MKTSILILISLISLIASARRPILPGEIEKTKKCSLVRAKYPRIMLQVDSIISFHLGSKACPEVTDWEIDDAGYHRLSVIYITNGASSDNTYFCIAGKHKYAVSKTIDIFEVTQQKTHITYRDYLPVYSRHWEFIFDENGYLLDVKHYIGACDFIDWCDCLERNNK